MLILAFEFSASRPLESAAPVLARALPASVVNMASAERRDLMNSLLDLTPSEPAIAPRTPVSPRPHSERKAPVCCA